MGIMGWLRSFFEQEKKVVQPELPFVPVQQPRTVNPAVFEARGYRNKNPGNIDFNPRNKWVGQVGIEPVPRDNGRPRFAVFSSHEYGIRAIAMLLQTYQDRHDLKTIRQLINRWAPNNENNTNSYVRFVDDFLPNRTADDPIDVHKYADARLLVEAIIRKEIGGNPYAPSVIDEGLRRAGVVA